MSIDKCRSIMYECTKLTPDNIIFSHEVRLVLENIVSLKKVPMMHLIVVLLSGIAHWCSRTLLNLDLDWNIPLIFYGVIVGYPGSNKSTAINLIERATREIERYLQIKIEDSRMNGSVTVESLLNELEKKRSIIQAFDEFNTFASCFSLYRADKAAYYRSVLNTLWNGPECYFRQLVKGDIKCEKPWLSIVAAAHPGAIINILKEDNNQLGADGLFARFVFSARISPEDVHKRSKRNSDIITDDLINKPSSYPSITHLMYFLYLMHHEEMITLKISQAANDILIKTHDEYNSLVIGFQGYQDILCTLFSKSRDHLYRICGLLHLLNQACVYVLKVEPQLEHLVFDDAAAESIQKVAATAKANMNDYITIAPETAQTAVDLMKFFVDTKKLLYGFPLVTIPPSVETFVGPSISQHKQIDNQIECMNHVVNDNSSVVSSYIAYDKLSTSSFDLKGSIVDLIIEKILSFGDQSISATKVAQLLRRPGVTVEKIKKIFTFLEDCGMGVHIVRKQQKNGKPRVLFIKDSIPKDITSTKYQLMVDFIKHFNITTEDYAKKLENNCDNSIDCTVSESGCTDVDNSASSQLNSVGATC